MWRLNLLVSDWQMNYSKLTKMVGYPHNSSYASVKLYMTFKVPHHDIMSNDYFYVQPPKAFWSHNIGILKAHCTNMIPSQKRWGQKLMMQNRKYMITMQYKLHDVSCSSQIISQKYRYYSCQDINNIWEIKKHNLKSELCSTWIFV